MVVPSFHPPSTVRRSDGVQHFFRELGTDVLEVDSLRTTSGSGLELVPAQWQRSSFLSLSPLNRTAPTPHYIPGIQEPIGSERRSGSVELQAFCGVQRCFQHKQLLPDVPSVLQVLRKARLECARGVIHTLASVCLPAESGHSPTQTSGPKARRVLFFDPSVLEQQTDWIRMNQPTCTTNQNSPKFL